MSKTEITTVTGAKLIDQDKEFLTLWTKAAKTIPDCVFLLSVLAYLLDRQGETQTAEKIRTHIRKQGAANIRVAIEQETARSATADYSPDERKLSNAGIVILQEILKELGLDKE